MKRVLMPVACLVIGAAAGSSISVLRAEPAQPQLVAPNTQGVPSAAGVRFTTTSEQGNLFLTDVSNGETWSSQPDAGGKFKWAPFIGPLSR